MLQRDRQTECMCERFLIQSYVALDFCDSFRVKQHSLFPPFDLPAYSDLSSNHASVSLSFLRKFSTRVPLGNEDRCTGGRVDRATYKCEASVLVGHSDTCATANASNSWTMRWKGSYSGLNTCS